MINTDLTTDLGRLRFYIGDLSVGKGPRPDGCNFSDLELGLILDDAPSFNSALVLSLRQLSVEWTSFALSESGQNSSFDAKLVADTYEKRAMKYETMPIDQTGQAVSTVFLTRIDAYS